MNDVLTDDDLVLLRAALHFWSEELEQHGPSAWKAYLDRSIAIRPGRSAELRQLLLMCQLRYATVQHDADPAESMTLSKTPLDASVATKDNDAVIATVLLPQK